MRFMSSDYQENLDISLIIAKIKNHRDVMLSKIGVFVLNKFCRVYKETESLKRNQDLVQFINNFSF